MKDFFNKFKRLSLIFNEKSLINFNKKEVFMNNSSSQAVLAPFWRWFGYGMILATLALLVLPVPLGLFEILILFSLCSGFVLLVAAVLLKPHSQYQPNFWFLTLMIILWRTTLNVVSTGKILGNAYAGEVIEAFGHFALASGDFLSLIFILMVLFALLFLMAFATHFQQKKLNRKVFENQVLSTSENHMRMVLPFLKTEALVLSLLLSIDLFIGWLVVMTGRGWSWERAFLVYARLSVGDALVFIFPLLATFLAVNLGFLMKKSS